MSFTAYIEINICSQKNVTLLTFLQNSKNVHVRYSSLQFAFEMTTKGSKTPTTFIAFQIMIMDIRSP